MTTHSEMPRLAYLMIITRHRFSGGSETSLRLGRTATKTVGGIETVSYDYNIRSWPTRIESAKFTELMGYNAAANGMTVRYPQWGGNIAAMLWRHGNGEYRGYELDYDDHGRLANAWYGGGLTFAGTDDSYEEYFNYDKMGNITYMLRNGKLDDGSYGTIDDLEMEYDGNQLTRVYDYASDDDPTYAGAMQFTDNSDEDVEYEYDANGNMTKDLNSNITSIQYNCLNLPESIIFTNRHVMDYVYNADGELQQMSARALHQLPRPQFDTKYYAGNVIFTGRFLSMLLTDEGYVTFASNGTPTYHYYLKDHLGNVRVVFNQTGTVEQVNHYYPYGGLTGESTGGSVQPYKYNGKELERMNSLDLYDYGARWMDAALGRFTTMDPLCEKYYSVSPYAYCHGNPINMIDPDGKDEWEINSLGQIVSRIETSKHDAFFIVDDNNKRIEGKSIFFKHGTVFNSFHSHTKVKEETNEKGKEKEVTKNFDVYEMRGDSNSTKLFEFMAENTSVEWGHMKFGVEGNRGYNVLTTSHEKGAEYGAVDMFNKQYRFGYYMREHTHSHPGNTPAPSGLTDKSKGSDMIFARKLQDRLPHVNLNIYVPKTNNYIPYSKYSTINDFE